MADEPFAFFVQSVPPDKNGEGGHVVPRFGVWGVYLGVRRPPHTQSEAEERARAIAGKPKGPQGWIWSPEPEGVTHAEYATYRREYDAEFAQGALTKLSADQAKAIIARVQERRRKVAEAAAKAAAEEQARAAEAAEAAVSTTSDESLAAAAARWADHEDSANEPSGEEPGR